MRFRPGPTVRQPEPLRTIRGARHRDLRLTGALHACRRVLVVPHAQLGLVPFAALTDGHVALGTCFELAVAPSARMALRGLQRLPVAPRHALALKQTTGNACCRPSYSAICARCAR